ncbi:MAG: ankyrin repeat domain-containing protein [Gammaproteobacteria bacterium]|nr:ankyrin repeat domain-containing protein [Gammaproteobacteria bacterium]
MTSETLIHQALVEAEQLKRMNEDLNVAVLSGQTERAKTLLDSGATLIFIEQTPLHLAVDTKQIPIVALLVEASANLEARDADGDTPIGWAANENSVEMVKYLADLGANITSTNDIGRTPLHWACYQGFTDLAKLLIDLGADPRTRDGSSKTPLQLAVENAHSETVDMLGSLQR